MDIWSYALETAIVSFSDQQVITGISIIIEGITQLGWGLDLYHWQTVANSPGPQHSPISLPSQFSDEKTAFTEGSRYLA
jgi:hypothetical protein